MRSAAGISISGTRVVRSVPTQRLAAATAFAVCIFAASAAAQVAPPQVVEDVLDEAFTAAAAPANRHYCAIMLVQEGQIRPNAENTELTSRAYGGQPGEADIITTNGSYALSIDPVLGFASAPNGAAVGTTFLSTFSGSGATGFSETPGTIPVRVKNGTTRVLVNFHASNSENGFPAGAYQADVTLRCE